MTHLEKLNEAKDAAQGSGDIDEAVKLSPEDLDKMMPEGDQVHTYMQGGFTLIGADLDRLEVLKAATEYGCELSGVQATAMKHGAVTWTEDGSPVFIETLPNVEDRHPPSDSKL